MKKVTIDSIWFLAVAIVLGCGNQGAIISKNNQTSSSDESKTPSSQVTAACLNITNGVQINPVKRPAVVYVEKDDSFCTGTFVGSNTVITAAHCLDKAQINGKPALANLSVRIGSQLVRVSTVYFPGVAGTSHVFSNDLAILVMPDSFAAPGIIPIATQASKVGDKFTIAGFGSLMGTKDKEVTNPDHYLFEGASKIHALMLNYIISIGERGTNIRSPVGQNSQTGPGDSGGPLFIGNYLAGLENWGTKTLTSEYLEYVYTEQMSAIPTQETWVDDTDAIIAKIPNLEPTKQAVAAGGELIIDFHLDLTAPLYLNWLKSLKSKGVDIRFDTDSPDPSSCR